MRSAEDLLTTAEVAEEYRVSTMTVRRWVKAGRLAASQLPSGTLRFRRSDVEAALQPVEATEASA